MLIADAVCFGALVIYLKMISRPKKETYTITQTQLILEKGESVTNVPLERISDIYNLINSGRTGDISVYERTDKLKRPEMQDGDDKYVHNVHSMKNVSEPERVCKILENAVRARGGSLSADDDLN